MRPAAERHCARMSLMPVTSCGKMHSSVEDEWYAQRPSFRSSKRTFLFLHVSPPQNSSPLALSAMQPWRVPVQLARASQCSMCGVQFDFVWLAARARVVNPTKSGIIPTLGFQGYRSC